MGLKYLRADLPLQEGYVVTVEPGVYFIRALLEDPALRARFRDAVDWPRVDRLLDFGGIRIEDDVHVTEAGPEVLSAEIPKSVAAIEELRAGAAHEPPLRHNHDRTGGALSAPGDGRAGSASLHPGQFGADLSPQRRR